MQLLGLSIIGQLLKVLLVVDVFMLLLGVVLLVVDVVELLCMVVLG